LVVCVQLREFFKKNPNIQRASILELYDQIFANDNRLDFDSFNDNMNFIIREGLVFENDDNTLTNNAETVKRIDDYIFEHRNILESPTNNR